MRQKLARSSSIVKPMDGRFNRAPIDIKLSILDDTFIINFMIIKKIYDSGDEVTVTSLDDRKQ